MRGGSSITCVLPLFPLAAVLQRPLPVCGFIHDLTSCVTSAPCHISAACACSFLVALPSFSLHTPLPLSHSRSGVRVSLTKRRNFLVCWLASWNVAVDACAHTHTFYSHASEGRGHRGSPGHRTLLSASLPPPPRHPLCLLFLPLLRPLNGCSLVLSQRFTQLGALVAD